MLCALLFCLVSLSSSTLYGMEVTFPQGIFLIGSQPPTGNNTTTYTPHTRIRYSFPTDTEIYHSPHNRTQGIDIVAPLDEAGDESRESDSIEQNYENEFEGASNEELRVFAFNDIIYNNLPHLERLLHHCPALIYMTNQPEGDTLLQWAVRKSDSSQLLAFLVRCMKAYDVSILQKKNKSGQTLLDMLYERQYWRFNEILEDLEIQQVLIQQLEAIEEELERARAKWLGVSYVNSHCPSAMLDEKQQEDTIVCNEVLGNSDDEDFGNMN